MWDHNININSSELLCIKIKVSRINKHKNIFKIDNLHFLPNYIFTRLFEELKKTYKNDCRGIGPRSLLSMYILGLRPKSRTRSRLRRSKRCQGIPC